MRCRQVGGWTRSRGREFRAAGSLENQWVRVYPAPLQQHADHLKVIPDAAKQAYDRGHAHALGMVHLQISEGLHIRRNQFGVGFWLR